MNANAVYDLFTLMILTLPVSEDARMMPTTAAPVYMASLQRVSLALELADRRESWRNYGVEILLVRDRYRDLKDAPRESDTLLLPPEEASTHALCCNRAYALLLERRRSIPASEAWLEAFQVNEAAYRAWEAARAAKSLQTYTTFRRAWLRTLRDALGPADYYAGRMPEPFPTWWLERR